MQTPCFRKLLLSLILTLPLNCALAHSEVLSEGWRFLRAPLPAAHAAQPAFDDSDWPIVRVPHDWAIEGHFEHEGDGGTGRLPWKGEGWYRQSFSLPAADTGNRVYLDFDGVMAFPSIYVNGQVAGEWDYGYTSFRLDVTPFVRWGDENTLAVHVDTGRWGSRWYPGAGIYRKVTLTVSPPVHVAHWGIQVDTATDWRKGESADAAHIRTKMANHLDRAAAVQIRHRIIAPDESVAASLESSQTVPARGEAEHRCAIQLDQPLLWDIDHPWLYTLETTVEAAGQPSRTHTTRFGFRSFKFTADDGFHLNGRRVQFYGVNNHHDLGPLGGAFNRRAAQRQLEILKEMGVNALRTAHNPPAPELLDLCDEMGILVWDEVFDKYAWTAGRPDLEPPLPAFSQRHIEATVLRDYNHPSIVVWSTGNEVWWEPELEGINPERVAMMAEFVREVDRTRPVAQGCHIPSLVDGKNFAALDLTGWNYARRYANYREQYPDKPIIYSESASTLSTRGYFDPELPLRKTDYSRAYQVSSYDMNAAAWSDIPEVEFQLMKDDAFVAGEFVWTGFDYLGEPTPFAEQARSSYFGIVDLCGFPKDRFYLYRSHWRDDVETLHILPHWNWPNRIGQEVPVFVYTSGDAAELFLNGRSLGMKRKGEQPPQPADLALTATATSKSASKDHPAGKAVDGSRESQWLADPSDPQPWWQIDLGAVRTVAQIALNTIEKENDYAYRLEYSATGDDWTLLADHPTRPIPRWAGPTLFIHRFPPLEARHFRITFDHSVRNQPIGLKSFEVYPEPVEDSYYEVTYDYRLRWNEVTYEPGELTAVAYRGGQVIAETTVETTGPAAQIRLTADRHTVSADAEELVFITVEALDAQDRPHPLANDYLRFELEGPASIAAVGNGNPLSFEPFLSDRIQLFYGKALLILRPKTGQPGRVSIRATSPELAEASLIVETQAP